MLFRSREQPDAAIGGQIEGEVMPLGRDGDHVGLAERRGHVGNDRRGQLGGDLIDLDADGAVAGPDLTVDGGGCGDIVDREPRRRCGRGG